MDYPYENLGPERFQQFCQALLVKELPDLQCLPVAQPDGGRDAFYYPTHTNEGFVVYQVKYVRKPFAEKDIHKWLIDTIAAEAPKLRNLIPRGAQAYYLLSNVPGTAHLDTGSIDRVNDILSSTLPIRTRCWWRDDLNRRLESARELKWAYPELMTGADALRELVESDLTENKARRTATLRAFVSQQYEMDEEVKFKQVDLQNKLLDLFVDVPLTLRSTKLGRRAKHVQIYLFQRLSELAGIGSPEAFDYDADQYAEAPVVGAATALLHAFTPSIIPRMVLEGAPGQGKSTLAQYVCQVHRMRLLSKEEQLQRIPEAHRSLPLRIPIKVDLRDYAVWLRKNDPFAGDDGNGPPSGWKKPLESFLVHLISHQSGGADFSIADLHAVAQLSSILLVLDGLDEVADVARRRELVKEVSEAASRLESLALSLQVVVTSRPAALANSPGFSERTFTYCELTQLTRPLIEEYTDRWIKARRLTQKEASSVKRVLKQRLHQPHLRDLARNPMQLAILLTLIYLRGSSLPDKRTALYFNYMQLFFDRESEKDTIVRDYRDLLIDIHGYLGWLLHAEAEAAGGRGSIAAERLEAVLGDYLAQEGHEAIPVQELFRGMVERVVALVSRVQGTFEFEVQPLREYFAARYLYDTAQYSPVGGERSGSLPDRFDAMARNF